MFSVKKLANDQKKTDRKCGRDRSAEERRPRPPNLHVRLVWMLLTSFLFQKSHCIFFYVGFYSSVKHLQFPFALKHEALCRKLGEVNRAGVNTATPYRSAVLCC